MTHEARSSAAPSKRWFGIRRASLLLRKHSRSTRKERRPPASLSTRRLLAPVTEGALCCYRNLLRLFLLNVARTPKQQSTPWSKTARSTAQKKQMPLRFWLQTQMTRRPPHKLLLISWNGYFGDDSISALAGFTLSNSAQLRVERATRVGHRSSCGLVTLKAIQRTS